MPWSTPTLATVRRLVRDGIAAKLPGADANIQNSVLRVLADVKAGVAHLVLLYVDWIAKQFLPDTAEKEWLDRHGQIWLGGRKAATYAEGSATVTGIAGTILPSGTVMAGGNGIEYQTIEAITVGSGATAVAVRALTPGVAGNLDAGASLALTGAVAGVDGSATVVLIRGGVDVESDDDLRARVLLRIRQPPMGGCKTDYEAWALAVPRVTRAWCSPLEMGMGTVTLRVMCDALRADADPLVDGFPLSEDIEAVAAYLDLVRPVAVKDFFVEAPIPQAIDFTITGLATDSSAVRAAIAASVKAMLRDRATPGQTIYRSWLDEAISAAVGEDHHELTFSTTAMASAGHMAVIGTVTYA